MMNARDLGSLLLLGALWGGSFTFIRVATPALGPFLLMELRVLLATAVLAAGVLLVAGWRSDLLRRWRGFLVLGTLNAAIPFTLIAASEMRLTASLAAILNSTTPLFGALVAAVWMGERLGRGAVAGLFLGVAGVIALVGWSPLPASAGVLLAVAASLAASLFYGVGSVYAKLHFSGFSAPAMAVGQLGGASAVLLLPAAVTLPSTPPGRAVVLSVLALALLSTAAAYLLYFRLLASVGPTRTLTVTFLVPAFGVLFGAVFLDESLGPGSLLGLALILTSLALVTGILPPTHKRKDPRP
ncbi:hypothetical protein Rxycam_02943 [Rubrobacter xylanophilus DSM 9941]|nr:hypothetical protein Rxycam_02943 [Rubrobacter xylanophilus DSM 9941]